MRMMRIKLCGRPSTGLAGLVLLAVCFLQLPMAVVAQEPEVRLDDMVVTGTKLERLPAEVPVRTEVINAKDIEKKGAANLYQALDGEPGLRVEQQCSYCNFSQVRMQGLESGHVQVLIDGQPMYSGLAGVYGLQQIPAINIDRVEIVKGAGSALYGSSAIAGVINVITRKPVEELADGGSTEAGVSFGADNTNTFTVGATRRFGEKADLVIGAQKSTGDEIDENGDNLTDRVWSSNITGSARVNYYGLRGDDRLTLSGSILNESRQGGDLTDGNWKNPFAESSEHINTRRNDLGVGYTRSYDNGNELHFQLTYAVHDRDATNDTFVGDYLARDVDGDGNPDDIHPPSNLLSPYLAEEVNNGFDVNYVHPRGEHRIMTGIQYGRNELEESGMYVRPATGAAYRSTSRKEADDWGLYVQDEWALKEDMDLVIGGRYDTHESSDSFAGSASVGLDDVNITYDETSFNPRLALLIRKSPRLTVRTSIGTGFRVPYNFSEDLHLCSGSPRVYKGTGLVPEESVSYTVSADYTGEVYTLSVSLFRTNLDNKIDIADADALAAGRGYDYQWENMGDAYTQGIELSAERFLDNDVLARAYLTFTEARYDQRRDDWVDHPVHGNLFAGASEHISRVPEHTAGLELSWDRDDWEFAVDADWTGKMYIDYYQDDDVANAGSEIVRTDSFWVVNTRVARNYPASGLTVFLGARNLFDEIQTDKRPDDAAFMYGPYTGRVIYAGMKMNF